MIFHTPGSSGVVQSEDGRPMNRGPYFSATLVNLYCLLVFPGEVTEISGMVASVESIRTAMLVMAMFPALAKKGNLSVVMPGCSTWSLPGSGGVINRYHS